MRASRPARRPLVPAAGSPPILFPTRLPRAHLEQALADLTEENAQLRRKIAAHGSLWQMAYQDQLTELWNRRYAASRLAEEMSRSQRENDYRFSMVLVDVDNLKRINDEAGHASGDEALKWVARFLREGLRGHDLCCRWGGDEFLLVLPGSGEQESGDLVERIRRRLRTAQAAGEQVVSVSMGAASFPSQGADVESLLVVADKAMYGNKRRRNPALPLGQPTQPAQLDHHETATNGIPTAHRLGAVATRLRRLLLFAACLFGLTCTASDGQRRSDGLPGRGLVVGARPGVIAIVTGPVLLHAYSDEAGTEVYLAPAMTGTDGDCALPPGAAPPEAQRTLRRNQSVVLAVPTGSVACASAGKEKRVELLWHAMARPEQLGPMTAQQQGPATRCCGLGR